MSGDGATWHEDQLIPRLRKGKLEEIYWTYGYSPIFLESGKIGGVLIVCTETTEQVARKHALTLADRHIQQESHRLKSLFNKTPIPLARLEGPNHRIQFANELYENYFLAGSDYRGKTVAELLPDAKDQGFVDLLNEVYNSGKRFVGKETPFAITTSSGEPKEYVFNFVYEPMRNAEGEVEGILAAISDVTEQVATRRKLEDAVAVVEVERHRFTSIFADAGTSMAITRGPTHIYEHANLSYLSLFDNRTLIGNALLDALPELRGQQFPELFNRVFESGSPYIEREAKAYLKRTVDGPLEERYFDQSYTRVLNADGSAYGIFIHAVEVSDRVFARQKILANEFQLKLATETAKLGAWTLDPITRTVVWSKRSAEIMGMPAQSQVTFNDFTSQFYSGDQTRFKEALEELIAIGSASEFHGEFGITWADQTQRWIQVSAKSSFSSADTGTLLAPIVGTILDVTERIEAQYELETAKEVADNASRAKSTFLANMSHEIRTPLGAIMGFIDLIKDEDIARETIEEYVSIIDRNSIQLLRIIDDILDLSKVEAGMMLIEHIEFSLVEMLTDFASLMGYRARDKGIVLEIKAKSSLPSIVLSDPTRLRQILTNIVGNAIKFTSHGSVTIQISFQDEIIEFAVKDTGTGISRDQAVGLFQPFSQADSTVNRKFGGTGLGLVLTRRLSEAMGGDFLLHESELGKGSTFVARVKLDVPPHAKLINALGYIPRKANNPIISGQLEGMKILVVEDSPDNQALISIILKKSGAKIDIVSNGSEGIAYAMAREYDVVLMDIQMPVMDGITAVRTLRSKSYQKPIIALTAHAMKEERERCLEAGFTDFLTKPIQKIALLILLATFAQQEAEI